MIYTINYDISSSINHNNLMNLLKEIEKIKTDWKDVLINEYNYHKDLWNNLEKFIEKEKKTYNPILQIFPPIENIFKAFTYFDLDKTKVIIIGQDCYHGKDQAMGLSFSVPKNIKIPPSLRNIFKELLQEGCIVDIPPHGDLTNWAQQGVILLNSSLTVREKCPMSHMKYWKPITDHLLKTISTIIEHPIIFVLWGNSSKSKKKFIDIDKHIVLEAVHPSPLSANRGGWFGCNHFSTINRLLKDRDLKPICWELS